MSRAYVISAIKGQLFNGRGRKGQPGIHERTIPKVNFLKVICPSFLVVSSAPLFTVEAMLTN